MARLILGTAGHIDHGKTSLIKALTGVDTDRLKEEKERGITIELGFAELRTSDEVHFGIVDVPGHEGFVRAMVAGATGMDVVMLVVAADEGVMPQTREHLQIVGLLEVPELVVAVTKVDLVEEEWLELVVEEVRELVSDAGYREAPIQPVSATEETGLDALLETLDQAGRRAGTRPVEDLARLPVDRVFSLPGAGTVVTGTLWSGSFRVGEKVRLLPADLEGRIRSLQNHGADAERVVAGDRTAMALTGGDIDLEELERGLAVVSHDGWDATSMLTTHVTVLEDTGWTIEPRQRVRVHLGTAEVLARVALLWPEAGEGIAGGESGWLQLRLEKPVCARAGDLLVLRSYSPVTTIGGGVVVEASPPKRKSLSPDERSAMERLRDGSPAERVEALLLLAGDVGVPRSRLPVLTGLTPGSVEEVLGSRPGADGGPGSPGWSERQGIVFGGGVMERSVHRVTQAVEAHHGARPLEGGMPLEAIRALFSRGGGDVLAAAAMDRLVSQEGLVVEGRLARKPTFAPRLDERHEPIRQAILGSYRDAGLTPPSNEEIAKGASDPALTEQVVGYLVAGGDLVALDGEYRILAEVLDGVVERIRGELAGRTGLGPSDFREVLPVTRKHLLPILLYTDKAGVTVRRVDGTRDVPGD